MAEVHYFSRRSAFDLDPENGVTPCGLPEGGIRTSQDEGEVTCGKCSHYLRVTTPWMRGEIDDTPGLDT